uniref:Ionotropic glutamate receptor L-glutamate and glycine-binding domain-containing protein n=1 Tax=Plectus sambesii TaxID=2011161 RepID=A0A914W4Y9_9BILA
MAAEGGEQLRRKVLRIGYVRTTSPYDLQCTVDAATIMTCEKVGVVGEIIRTIANVLNYELQFVQTDNYGDRPNPDGQWPGLTGMLMNGTIDATNGVWMTNELLHVIKFTVPIASTDTGIVAGRLLSADADAPMDFVLFSPLTYLIFIPVLLAAAAVLKAAKRGSTIECIWRAFAIIMWKHNDRALHPLMLIGVLLFVLNYFANFRGQRLISALQTVVPAFQIEQDLRSGRLRLIARHKAILKHDMLQDMYGTTDPYSKSPFPPLIEPSNARIVQLLCERRDLVYYGDILALFSGDQPDKRTCQLSRIEVDSASSLSFTAQWGLGIRPNFDNHRLDDINNIIQRAFSPSMLQNYYFKQYSSAAATDPNAAPVQQDFNPIIGLAQLRYAFYLYIGGVSVAVSAAIIERLLARKKRTYFINAEQLINKSDNWSLRSETA